MTPKGFLPVFAVDDEEEAKMLIVAACKCGHDGEYYAPELMHEQTLDNLEAFSTRIDQIHDRMIERGYCRCRKENG